MMACRQISACVVIRPRAAVIISYYTPIITVGITINNSLTQHYTIYNVTYAVMVNYTGSLTTTGNIGCSLTVLYCTAVIAYQSGSMPLGQASVVIYNCAGAYCACA